MKLKVDLDKLTLGDLIALEERKSTRVIRDLMARFCVNDEGAYLEYAAAQNALDKLTLREVNIIAGQFAEALKGATTDAIPPTGSGKS